MTDPAPAAEAAPPEPDLPPLTPQEHRMSPSTASIASSTALADRPVGADPATFDGDRSAVGQDPITDLTVLQLPRGACAAALARVEGARDRWLPRPESADEPPHRWTLGHDTGLDVGDSASFELSRSVRMRNDEVHDCLEPLSAHLSDALASVLGAPVVVDDWLPRPGCLIEDHEALTDLRRARPVGDPRPHLHVPELDDIRRREAQRRGGPERHGISFSLSLRVPARGSGINLWSTDDWGALLAARGYVPDEVAQLVVLRSELRHQVVVPLPPAPGDVRVTVQGHGIWTGVAWLLYC